jgi:hypothetical protein
LTHNPAQVDICGEISTEGDWSYLRGVGSSHGLEDTPRNALEYLASEKHWEVLREERDENEATHRKQCHEDRLAVPDFIDNNASSIETEDFTDLGTI